MSEYLRDPDYLASMEGAQCASCWIQDETVVGHHNRHGRNWGMGIKPPDDLVMPLCSKCHELAHGTAEQSDWVRNNVLNTLLKKRYMEWKGEE